MCGRFASARKRQELLEEFGVQRDRVERRPAAGLQRGPDQADLRGAGHGERRPATRNRAERPDCRRPAKRVARELRVVRWGLVPVLGQGHLDRQPPDQRAGRDRGGQARVPPRVRPAPLPAARRTATTSGRRPGTRPSRSKQPYFIHRADGGVLAFAGLYELWRDKAVPDDDPRAWLWTATIITTRAEDEVGRIHDRMPMVIEPARWADWLDPAASQRRRAARAAGASRPGGTDAPDVVSGVDGGQFGTAQRAGA